jgi:hypothetical protein
LRKEISLKKKFCPLVDAIQRDSSKLEVDKDIKNCWKWEWLERSVDANPVGQFIRKIDSREVVRCQLCQKDINYAGRSWRSLELHLKKKLEKV